MQPVRQFDRAELERFAKRFDQAAMEGWLGELLDRMSSHAFAAPGYERLLAQRVRALIASRRPASCLRLGDGEGNILGAGDTEFRNLQRLSAQKAAEMHLGRWFPSSVLGLWRSATYEAIRNADVIGVPCTERIRSLFRNLDYAKRGRTLDIRGACGTINALRFAHAALSTASPDRLITNCWFHRDLLPYYREILRGISELGIVSCYPELAEKLRQSFGVEKVTVFAIPNQISNTGERPPSPHYPQVFTSVMERLGTIAPGQPVLVAAGLLGKIYCDRIKKCGGIALDIGSVADVWMGRRARRYHDATYLEKWAL